MSVRSSCSLPSLLFFPLDTIFPPPPPPPPQPPAPAPAALSKADVKADAHADEDEEVSGEVETASAFNRSAGPLAAAAAAPLRPNEELLLSEREESSTLRLRGVELDLHFSGTS